MDDTMNLNEKSANNLTYLIIKWLLGHFKITKLYS